MSLENAKIQTGDVVRLNSGGPALTVSLLRLTPDGRTLVTVNWLDDEGQPEQREWDAAMLTPAAPDAPAPPPPPVSKPPEPPAYRAIRAFGFVYYANTSDGHGWITRETRDHPYQCFFCDGRRKESAERGSLQDAQAWMEQFY